MASQIKERKRFFHPAKILLWLVLVCTLTQCSPQNDEPIVYPEDTPMSEFIIGTWKIVSVTDAKSGNTTVVNFPGFRFEDETTVSYSDFHRAVYEFAEPDVITVDNKRVLGIETWRLERKGDNLFIHATVHNETKKYLLERCSGSWWC